MSKQLITSFDPTATTSGQFLTQLPMNQQINGIYGYLLLANESSVSLILTVNSDRFRVHPWQLEKIVLTEPTQFVAWQQEVILSNAATSPISLVLVDGYTPDEIVANTYPIPLVRNTNVGGIVATSTTNTLVNDGSAPNTQIIETTPSDQATSAFKLDNEGNLTIRTVDSGVWSVILSIVEGSGGGAATKLFHGTADNVPASGVTAGALPAGVTSPNYLALTGGTLTGELKLATAESGSDVELIQYLPSDASPAARWVSLYRHSDSALLFKDQSNGHVPITMTPTAGASGFYGTLTPQHGNGTFGIRGDFSGTGSGTVATGAGVTPTICLIIDSQSGSSMTVGVVISGTSAIVTAGAAHTWLGVAL